MHIDTKPKSQAPDQIQCGITRISEFGEVFMAWSGDVLLYLGFSNLKDGKQKIRKSYPKVTLIENQKDATQFNEGILKAWRGEGSNLKIMLYGTAFQINVWQALLKIQRGVTKTYSDIANDVKSPKATRAIGTAIGANPISLLVPCHRVVPKSGGVGNYYWGSEVKARLLELEQVV